MSCHVQSYQDMGILHIFSNCVKATFNHELSPSEVDWGDPKGEPTKMLKYTSSGCMLMEVDWAGKLSLHTSSNCESNIQPWAQPLRSRLG